MSDSIHQEVTFNAKPEAIYRALTDSNEFSQLTGGAPAEISVEGGGKFSLFGGKIVGRNIDLKANELVVQAWRSADWDEGVYTVIKFELKEDSDGTHLVFDQTGIPEGNYEHLKGGWSQMYWEPIKRATRLR